jgi:hypothetical protein
LTPVNVLTETVDGRDELSDAQVIPAVERSSGPIV